MSHFSKGNEGLVRLENTSKDLNDEINNLFQASPEQQPTNVFFKRQWTPETVNTDHDLSPAKTSAINDIIIIDEDGISTPPTKKVAIQSDIQNKSNMMDDAMVDGDDDLDKLQRRLLIVMENGLLEMLNDSLEKLKAYILEAGIRAPTENGARAH
ncbi:9833_t:CDS:2 [Paraglomus brasilianum]|uniref:9833_t:CDS:1 n=1 Tax=Paraglomus brasilianum TaxID=144538 RepID=A0A9N9DXK9_9GLOM|nr:9833_t:CDS:2 [Paraglomus brasilianum]